MTRIVFLDKFDVIILEYLQDDYKAVTPLVSKIPKPTLYRRINHLIAMRYVGKNENGYKTTKTGLAELVEVDKKTRAIKAEGTTTTEEGKLAVPTPGGSGIHSDFRGIESACVYENDDFSADLGSGQVTHKISNIQNRGKPIALWCRVSRDDRPPYVRIIDEFDVKDIPKALDLFESKTMRACYRVLLDSL